KDVVGVAKYERLIYVQRGVWHEKLFRGEDPTWGLMDQLRRSPSNPNPNWKAQLAWAAERAAEAASREAAQAAQKSAAEAAKAPVFLSAGAPVRPIRPVASAAPQNSAAR